VFEHAITQIKYILKYHLSTFCNIIHKNIPSVYYFDKFYTSIQLIRKYNCVCDYEESCTSHCVLTRHMLALARTHLIQTQMAVKINRLYCG